MFSVKVAGSGRHLLKLHHLLRVHVTRNSVFNPRCVFATLFILIHLLPSSSRNETYDEPT